MPHSNMFVVAKCSANGSSLFHTNLIYQRDQNLNQIHRRGSISFLFLQYQIFCCQMPGKRSSLIHTKLISWNKSTNVMKTSFQSIEEVLLHFISTIVKFAITKCSKACFTILYQFPIICATPQGVAFTQEQIANSRLRPYPLTRQRFFSSYISSLWLWRNSLFIYHTMFWRRTEIYQT